MSRVMASNVMRKNGHVIPPPEIIPTKAKILVIGDKKCGKSRFIKVFHDRNGTGDHFAMDYARVYPCQYEARNKTFKVSIYEIPGGPDDQITEFTKSHFDSDAFVFMYAIDDPSGFERLPGIWIKAIKESSYWNNTDPTILVGSKKDLRNNEQVIQRLAQDNKVPVTEQDGENLRENQDIRKFYECSSLDEDDGNIHAAFHYLIMESVKEWLQNNP